MTTVLAYLWTKAELTPIWRQLSSRRHRSELNALRRAKIARRHKAMPIFRTLFIWYFVFGLPPFVLTVAGVEMLYGNEGVLSYLGGAIFTLGLVYSFVFSVLVLPWAVRWYFIAVGITLGRTAMADKKESELVAAIAAAERDGVP